MKKVTSIKEYIDSALANGKETKAIKEEAPDINYMVTQNLQNIVDHCNTLLSLAPEKLDEILKGHPWAVDHIATSKDDIEEVAGFIKTQK